VTGRTWFWAGTAFFVVALASALAAFAPASLVGRALERASDGRLILAGTHGRIWAGRGTLLAPKDSARVLLAWTLTPAALLTARVAGELRIGAAEPTPFEATWERITLGRIDAALPAALVAAALGPFEGYKIGGVVRVRAERAAIDRDGGAGRIYLEWNDAASGLIDVTPLGSYQAELEATAQGGTLAVRTRGGPLLLDGTGRWSAGGAALQLTARASGERQQTLQAWLSTMAPQQADGSYRFVWPQPSPAQRRGPRS